MGIMIAVFAALLIMSVMRLNHYMLYYQQEEYDHGRFLRLIFSRGARLIDKKLSGLLLVALGLTYWQPTWQPYVLPLVIALMLGAALLDFRALKQAKKKLVYTNRVKRILAIAFLLSFIALSAYCGAMHLTPKWGLVIWVQLLPFILILSNLLLTHYEAYNQKHFYDDAVAKLQKLRPVIIAMTGSYGKTSVKHILAHMLSQVKPTLATPGSVNTVMGITRIIREKLKKRHHFFIAEMGAYGIGSIARLCRLCPPDHGILTAVGNAHYERFKSVEAVAQAKFELFQATAEKQGYFVVNMDQVDPAFIKEHAGHYGDKLVKIATREEFRKQVDFFVDYKEQTPEGLFIRLIHDDGQRAEIKAPLYGLHHVNNIVVCYALAIRLGVPSSTLIASLKTVPQIKHRLEVKRYDNQPDIIDDAYNSNPEGFEAALDVLKILAEDKGGRAYLLTPGMVELGELHDEKHSELSKKAAAVCDDILIVGAERIKSFVEGLDEQDANYKIFESFASAKKYLNKHAKADDVILYENDLPDLYESSVSL